MISSRVLGIGQGSKNEKLNENFILAAIAD
jgi:hypothetical protein